MFARMRLSTVARSSIDREEASGRMATGLCGMLRRLVLGVILHRRYAVRLNVPLPVSLGLPGSGQKRPWAT